MDIAGIIDALETFAPPALQESYDNAGLITGDKTAFCSGILCTLDVNEAILDEAMQKGCNLVVSHHPIIFKGLKKLNGENYVERTIIKAIRNNVALYAAHTNLDNIKNGVNNTIAEKLNLINRNILFPKENQLLKLQTYVPVNYADVLRNALFAAGAGNIGNYSECSFNTSGTGTFKAGKNTAPFTGEKEKLHEEAETKIEVIFPVYLKSAIIKALLQSHPYEEAAYDLIPLVNNFLLAGSGLTGELKEEMSCTDFLQFVKETFNLEVIKHTSFINKKIKKIALCGGAGSFLINIAIKANADAYITSDIKYHEFFDADNKLLLADIGHWESEQYTIDLLQSFLQSKFPNFAVLKTGTITNPVHYFT